VASLAPGLGLPPPRAVVLEGILGRSPAGGFSEYVAGYDAEWQRVLAALPPAAAAQLRGAAPPRRRAGSPRRCGAPSCRGCC
jgi:hypothetical protein